MDNIYNKLVIKQKISNLEMFTGIETKNKYSIFNYEESNKEIYYAYEESNSFLRFLFKSDTSMKIIILDLEKNQVLRLEKDITIFFPKFKVFDKNNILIGYLNAKFGLNSKIFINNANKQNIGIVKNTVMHPWTFKYYKNNIQNDCAIITKEWSGIVNEFFSDADNFSIDFKDTKDNIEKSLLFASAFAIDIYAFERR